MAEPAAQANTESWGGKYNPVVGLCFFKHSKRCNWVLKNETICPIFHHKDAAISALTHISNASYYSPFKAENKKMKAIVQRSPSSCDIPSSPPPPQTHTNTFAEIHENNLEEVVVRMSPQRGWRRGGGNRGFHQTYHILSSAQEKSTQSRGSNWKRQQGSVEKAKKV